MCAINPTHKKRINFDFYTSHPLTKEQFEAAIIEWSLKMEQTLNQYGTIRVHVKESKEEAD